MKILLKLAIIIVLLFNSLTKGQSGNWEIAGKMPIKISGSEAVVVDSAIYFFGGYSDSLQNAVDWIYSYKPLEGSWKFIGHMKKRRTNFIADKIGNKIFCVGGEVSNPPRPGGSLEEFDCNTLNTAIIDSNKNFDRAHATGLIKDSILYLIGGMLNGPPSETSPYIIEYSIPLRKIIYNYIPSFPGMRAEQMSSFLYRHLFIFGGFYNTVSSDIFSFGILDHQLTLQHLGLIRPRTNGRAIKLEDSNQVVILGGYNEVNNALNSVELYNFIDSVNIISRPIQTMKFKRNNLMAIYFEGSIYVFGGEDEFGNPIDTIEKLGFITDIKEKDNQTTDFKIDQNYPNPFNLSTIIKYYVPETSLISVRIYDLMGREVANLVKGERQEGNYKISFNGNGLASGVYYYRIEGARYKGIVSKNFTATKKMILLK